MDVSDSHCTCVAVSVGVYFADLISDVQVTMLLLNTGNYVWGTMSVLLLTTQFLVVYLRVLPYMHSTFGGTSSLYITFLLLGFPSGLLMLDVLMFFEPFGLLALLPFPEWVRQFVPAYKATRIIAEVVIESLPQCVLQSYIYVIVIFHSNAGTASPSELAMLDFASVIPTSLIISTIAMLKLWIEVVMGAKAAGLTIRAKAIQLWDVGAGLPLDALKKGTIVDWKCPYKLEGPEVAPLLDALARNSSLTKLDLTASGLTWSGVGAMGAPLLENISQNPATLGALKSLKISSDSGYIVSILALERLEELPRRPTCFPFSTAAAATALSRMPWLSHADSCEPPPFGRPAGFGADAVDAILRARRPAARRDHVHFRDVAQEHH